MGIDTDGGDPAPANVKRHTLCGVQGCCPIVDVDITMQTVVLRDDFGGVVTLTFTQWAEAREKVQIS